MGEPTPLRADFAAKLAFSLCLPPMGATKYQVSKTVYDLVLRPGYNVQELSGVRVPQHIRNEKR